MNCFNLCKNISNRVKKKLVKKFSITGFVGDTCLNPHNLKSIHSIDKLAIKII